MTRPPLRARTSEWMLASRESLTATITRGPRKAIGASGYRAISAHRQPPAWPSYDVVDSRVINIAWAWGVRAYSGHIARAGLSEEGD